MVYASRILGEAVNFERGERIRRTPLSRYAYRKVSLFDGSLFVRNLPRRRGILYKYPRDGSSSVRGFVRSYLAEILNVESSIVGFPYFNGTVDIARRNFLLDAGGYLPEYGTPTCRLY